jgi:hypothetical protein
MMKRFVLLSFAALLLAASSFAQKPTKVIGPGEGVSNFRVPFHQTSNVTLSKDTIYILTGWYFVDSTKSLTIQAGTLVFGDSASGGTLIVSRGAKINAAGTQTSPVIFTSRKAPGQRRPGDWGGVILLGNAPTNKPTTQQVEGGFGTIPNTNAMYGGPDADDSTGVFQYARIEFAGIAFAQDNEINGLTLGAVGRKTVIDHVQVSFANDDDYEFFGGTVQAKYLIGWRSLDDCFDTDFGFAGKIQFAMDKRDPAIFDASASGSSNGFESDNEGSSPYSATPRTRPMICNFTLIGPAPDSTAAKALNAKWDHTAMIRRASELSLYNSVLVGWKNGINVRDTLSQRAAIDGRLEIRNTSIAVPNTPVVLSTSPNTGNIAGLDAIAWFNTAAFGNRGGSARQATDILPPTAFNLDNSFNPVPAASGELATAGTSYTQGRLAGDSWFTAVSYRGAFDPSKPMSQQWTAGWTNFDPQGTNYLTSVETRTSAVPAEFMLDQNYPNPFNPTTMISYRLASSSVVSLKIYDLLGQQVATLASGLRQPGAYSVQWDGRNDRGEQVSSGVYFYKLASGTSVVTRKMMLTK